MRPCRLSMDESRSFDWLNQLFYFDKAWQLPKGYSLQTGLVVSTHEHTLAGNFGHNAQIKKL